MYKQALRDVSEDWLRYLDDTSETDPEVQAFRDKCDQLEIERAEKTERDWLEHVERCRVYGLTRNEERGRVIEMRSLSNTDGDGGGGAA